MNKYKRHVLALLVGVCLGGGLYGIRFAKATQEKHESPRQKVTAPEVVSCVKNIKVLETKINDEGTPYASVTVKVENTSDLGIIAVALETTNGKDTYTVRKNSFEADEPTPLIKPHETHTLSMELSNVFPNAPLQIGSVMYINGAEAGCEESIKAMRNSKTHHERLKAERNRSLQ